MVGSSFMVRKLERWSPLPVGFLKFHVDGATREKLWQAGIGGVLCNQEGLTLLSLFSIFGVKDSNEAEILAILEALFRVLFRQPMIVESDCLIALDFEFS